MEDTLRKQRRRQTPQIRFNTLNALMTQLGIHDEEERINFPGFLREALGFDLQKQRWLDEQEIIALGPEAIKRIVIHLLDERKIKPSGYPVGVTFWPDGALSPSHVSPFRKALTYTGRRDVIIDLVTKMMVIQQRNKRDTQQAKLRQLTRKRRVERNRNRKRAQVNKVWSVQDSTSEGDEIEAGKERENEEASREPGHSSSTSSSPLASLRTHRSNLPMPESSPSFNNMHSRKESLDLPSQHQSRIGTRPQVFSNHELPNTLQPAGLVWYDAPMPHSPELPSSSRLRSPVDDLSEHVQNYKPSNRVHNLHSQPPLPSTASSTKRRPSLPQGNDVSWMQGVKFAQDFLSSQYAALQVAAAFAAENGNDAHNLQLTQKANAILGALVGLEKAVKSETEKIQ